jgi:hypothetical protein
MKEEIKPITPCECPFAKTGEGGYCSRHHIRKNAHFAKLCATRQEYFDMYELCAGPGQEFTSCDGKEEDYVPEIKVDEDCPSCKKDKQTPKAEEKPPHKMPSLWQQAKNFTKAAATHVATGMKEVSPEVKQARLDVCAGCEFYKSDTKQCKACGCFLPIKTKWLANSCPKGKWVE